MTPVVSMRLQLESWLNNNFIVIFIPRAIEMLDVDQVVLNVDTQPPQAVWSFGKVTHTYPAADRGVMDNITYYEQ